MTSRAARELNPWVINNLKLRCLPDIQMQVLDEMGKYVVLSQGNQRLAMHTLGEVLHRVPD